MAWTYGPAGIVAPATFANSTDANTLDDYEEGTWTPAANGNWATNPTGVDCNYVEFISGSKKDGPGGLVMEKHLIKTQIIGLMIISKLETSIMFQEVLIFICPRGILLPTEQHTQM